LDKIYWNNLSKNPNPDVIHLIRNNLDKVLVSDLSRDWLAKNPNVSKILGTLDLEKMRSNCQPFAKELAEYVFHPTRLVRVCGAYDLDLADYMELIGD